MEFVPAAGGQEGTTTDPGNELENVVAAGFKIQVRTADMTDNLPIHVQTASLQPSRRFEGPDSSVCTRAFLRFYIGRSRQRCFAASNRCKAINEVLLTCMAAQSSPHPYPDSCIVSRLNQKSVAALVRSIVISCVCWAVGSECLCLRMGWGMAAFIASGPRRSWGHMNANLMAPSCAQAIDLCRTHSRAAGARGFWWPHSL